MSEELKQCPFCGLTPVLNGGWVQCVTRSCADFQHVHQPSKWNTRAVSPELATDAGRTDEEQIETLKQINSLELARQQIKEKQRDLADLDFAGRMSTDLTKLSDAWANLGSNLAGGVLDSIRNGVNGIGSSIMSAIEGTRTWGQVFADVGRGIIASIIQVVAQWIISMTVIKLLKKLFGVEDKTEAAESAASWAPAAAMSATGTSGGSAVAAGIAVAAVLALIIGMVAAFKEGGQIPGGEQLIRVNEEGPEFVVKNSALRKYGTGFFNKLNQGILDTYTLMNAAGGSLTRPVTSEELEMQSMGEAMRPGGSRAGGSGPIHVKPSDVHVVVVKDQAEYQRFMESNAGKNITVKHVNGSRNELGIGS